MKKLLTLGVIGAVAFASMNSFANHSVLVEGESDFDGDGSVMNGVQMMDAMMMGLAEDLDGDNVFATFAAALGSVNQGINNNGSVTCVTSGRFGELLNLDVANNGNSNATGGNIVVQAAPGAECIIEAFFAGNNGNARAANFSSDNATRQAAPGIIINTPANRQVIIRNLSIENWTDCVTVSGSSRVVLDNVRCNNNIGVGVSVSGSANVDIINSQIVSQGFRQTGGVPTQNFPDSAVDNGDGTFNDGMGMLVDFDGRGVVCTGATTCRLTTSQVKGSCRDGITMGPGAVVVVRGSSVSDSGNVPGTVCNGVDFGVGFDFSNFLPN